MATMNTAKTLLILAFFAMTVAAADDAEFAFNLLTDIAPVLALFGDQFAKQFTSESLTWVDHLIFAMVPLGIITAITGAIRVQGTPLARAFIGRARESRAQAEIELMSSTSDEVCEIFNGNSIVRAIGSPQIAQFLIYPSQYKDCEKEWKRYDNMLDESGPESDPEKISCGIHSLRTAQEQGHLKCVEYRGRSTEFIRTNFQYFREQLQSLYRTPLNKPQRTGNNEQDDPETVASGKPEDKTLPPGADRVFRSPPNIQLNHTSDHFAKHLVKKHQEIFLAATTGILLQTGLLVIASIVAYRVSPESSDLFTSKVYGFPCYVVGSLLLCLGTGLCSFIVERNTDEYSWMAVVGDKPVAEHNAPQLLWLQTKQSVSDQFFNGYVIAAGPKRRVITSSRNDKPDKHRAGDNSKDTGPSDEEELLWEWLTIGAALSASLGFISQFVGLRGLAFPCSLAQLGAILVMALIRAGIRRRLGEPMEHCNASQWYEIDFLATRIVFDQGPCSPYWVTRGSGESSDPNSPFVWSIITPDQKQDYSRHLVRVVKDSGTKKVGEDNEEYREQPSGDVFEINQQAGSNSLTSPSSQHLLRVRRRLGDLSHWKTRSSPKALALAQSIELVMNEFFPAFSGHSDSLNWLVEAGNSTVPGNRDTIQFVISRKKSNNRFEVDLGLIDAAISLWMATIDAKKQQATDDRSKSSKRAADWRRERTGDSLIYDYYRIIGDNLKDSVLKRDISWWIDSTTASRSDPQLNGVIDSGKGIRREVDVELVIGFNGIKQGVDPENQERTGVIPNEVQINELGISSEESLPTILAQHLFTSFMWTVAQKLPENCLQPNNDDAEKQIEVNRPRAFESYDFDQVWPKLRLNHQRLDSVVSKLEAYGLGNRRDILLCIIPALSARKMLPNQVVLRLVPQMTHSTEWSEIATCHQKLLETIETEKISIYDKLDVGIVVATMDFLSFACENYDERNAPLGEMDNKIKNIAQKLTTARFADIFKELALVYSKQDRRSMFSSIFKRFGCPDPLAVSAEINTTAKIDKEFAEKTLGFTYNHFAALEPWMRRRHILLWERQETARSMTVKDIFGWTSHHYDALAGFSRFYTLDVQKMAQKICGLRCGYMRSPLDVAFLGGRDMNIERLWSHLSPDEKNSAIQGCGIDGMTPLHLIAKCGSLSSLSSLQLIARTIDLRPHVTRKDFWGREALHIASRLGHIRVAVKFLELGAHSNTLDERGKTSVDYFLESTGRSFARAVSREIVAESDVQVGLARIKAPELPCLDEEGSRNLLRFAMTDPNCRYGYGRTFLHIATAVANKSSIYTLLERGFLLDAKDDDGRTPLHYAIVTQREAISRELMAGVLVPGSHTGQTFKSSVLSVDNRNTTKLMLAANKNLRHTAEAILYGKIPIDIDMVDVEGKTALHHAQGVGMVRLLVGEGADTVIKDLNGRTKLHLALEEGDAETATFLLDLEDSKVQEDPFDHCGISLLATACKQGLLKLIASIVQKWKGILDEEDSSHGWTPLAWACRNGHKDVVIDLIGRGADVNKTGAWSNKYTPLHICAVEKRFDVLNILVEEDLKNRGTNRVEIREGDRRLKLEARDVEFRTPLQICIDSDSVDEECAKAISNLLPHDRTSSSERFRSLQRMVQAWKTKESYNLGPVVSKAFRKTIEDDLTQEFVVWLVIKEQWSVHEAQALALLSPLVELLKSGQQGLTNLGALVSALWNNEIREIVESKQIDEQSGRDIDGWSCATYIERYDSHGTLADLVTQLRLNIPSEDLEIRSKSLDWYSSWKDIWKSVQITPCISNHPTTHSEVSEITVAEPSDLYYHTCIRTKRCISASAKHFYFEIEILENSSSRFVAIGFSGFTIGMYNMPGHFEKSWGYHGDDGKLFVEGAKGFTPNDNFGSSGTYSKGDTVGVYLDTKTGRGFCTKNGKKLDIGNAFAKSKGKFRLGKMYPCIGFSPKVEGVGLRFRVNLTGTGEYPFKYQIPREKGQPGSTFS